MGQARPSFAHLPTVLAADGDKLSKRAGAASVADLRAEGYPAEAIVNQASLLGWSHLDEQEVLTPQELTDAVTMDRVGRSDPRTDPEKLRWLSAQHIAAEPLDRVARSVAPFVDRARFPLEGDDLERAVDAVRTRLVTYGEINEHLPLLFPREGPDLSGVRALVAAESVHRNVLQALKLALSDVQDWDGDTTGAAVRMVGKETGVRGPALFHPIRLSLTGLEQGADLGKVLAALGREETLRRIDLTLGGGGV
jgi:glutamyl/glutaminyl-tRNA synthetase